MFFRPVNTRGGGGLRHMTSTFVINQYLPSLNKETEQTGPKRYAEAAPSDQSSFIKPLKAAVIKDSRLMPGTRTMLAMLAGWAGRNTIITTTTGAIGRNLGRSERQAHRYLKDAARLGYLTTCKTKDRMGYITGLKVFLNFGAVRHYYEDYLNRKRAEYTKTQETRAQTFPSDINYNSLLEREDDPEVDQALQRMAHLLGLEYEHYEGYG